MEETNYNKMVAEKLARQKEEAVVPPVDDLISDHKYIAKFWVKKDYEYRKFLYFYYKKLVLKQIIPLGVCDDCDMPEELHNV